MISYFVQEEATAWHQKYKKPVLMSEYGDDTMPGLHEVKGEVLLNVFLTNLKSCTNNFSFQLPSFVWSEEYQAGSLSKHFEAFDSLRQKGFFIGEFIWNFADFRTDQCEF